MAIERALEYVIVGTNLPLAPKIDLVLTEDGLSVVEDVNELAQSVARLPLAQLGDSIFYPSRGIPWLRPRVGSALPIFTSSSDPHAKDRIAFAVDRALARHGRVISSNTSVWYDDNQRKAKINTKVRMYDKRFFNETGLLELNYELNI